MTPYDWAIVAIAAAFIIRGWVRGAVREALEVAVLVLGSLIAFRLSPPIGSILAGMASIPYEVARVVAGVLIYGSLVTAAIILGRLLATAMHVVPGTGAIDRIGGALAGAAFAAVVIVLGTTVAVAAPMPSSAKAAVTDAVDGSVIGHAVIDPDGAVQPVVTVASGERVLAAVVAVQDAVGDRLVSGLVPIRFPAVGADRVHPSQVIAQTAFDELNRERIASGADPLGWSPDLAIVAVARAREAYLSGRLGADQPLGDAIAAAGIPGTLHADLVVLAASADGVVEAITTTGPYRDMVVDRAYAKSGIGVIEGPYGLIAVQVLSG